MNFLNANGIDALDLAPFFAMQKNPKSLWVSDDDSHPNKAAHKLIAEYTFDFIKEGLS